MSRVRNLVDYQSQISDLDGDSTRNLNINGTITATAVDSPNVPDVNLTIAPETLEIQVDAPDAGQDIMWKWTWEQSTLPYARRTITNSAELSVPLYKEGTYVVNNFAAYDIHGSMTQTHSLYLKWVNSAGTDNLVSWASSAGPISDTHPDINGGNATDVQRITVSVPATITPPSLTNPSVAYTVTNNASGSYTFSGSAKGDNPNIGPFYRGGTYTINISATGHPFYFTTDNGTNFSAGTYFGEYTTGVTGSRTDSGTITFTVPAGAPDTLYYQCGNHSAMRGEITVKDLAVETNINGNYVVYFQHTQEGHATPVELRPIPSLVNQMCIVYDAGTNKFVPQDLATYVENTPSFENKIREVAGTAELVVEDGSAVIAKVNVYDDSTYLPLTGNNPGDQAFATDTDILYIWDGSAWQQAGAANSDDLTEGTTNLFYTDARVGTYLSGNGYDTATNIIATITDSAPTTLDTLNELAAALGDDPNFATTTANNIALKAPLADPEFTGHVGINFSNPSSTGSRLVVLGDAGSNALFVKGNAGSGTSWGLGVNAGSTSADASFRVYDKDGSASYVYVRGDGNVGIGTASPADKMHIYNDSGTTVFRADVNSNSTVGLEINKTGSTTQSWKIADGITHNGALQFYDATDAAVRMHINGDGLIGIGSTSPDRALTIEGSDFSSSSIRLKRTGGGSSNDAGLQFESAAGANADTGLGGIWFQNSLDGNAYALIRARTDDSTGTSGRLDFMTSTSLVNNSSSPSLTIKSSGNVGIGTSAPGMTLDVDGSSGPNDIARFSGPNSGGITFRNSTSNEFVMHTATSDALVFGTNGNNERVRITSDGVLRVQTAGNTVDGTYYSTATINNTGSNTYSRLRFDRSGSARWGLTLNPNDQFSISKLYNSVNDNTLVIDDEGKVGINTNSPHGRFYVSGGVMAHAFDGGGNWRSLGSFGQGSGTYCHVKTSLTYNSYKMTTFRATGFLPYSATGHGYLGCYTYGATPGSPYGQSNFNLGNHAIAYSQYYASDSALVLVWNWGTTYNGFWLEYLSTGGPYGNVIDVNVVAHTNSNSTSGVY
tara:strand:- start:1205 stop:4390 length:3186 start_codon:yes stop_codon:yes gene_type:complete